MCSNRDRAARGRSQCCRGHCMIADNGFQACWNGEQWNVWRDVLVSHVLMHIYFSSLVSILSLQTQEDESSPSSICRVQRSAIHFTSHRAFSHSRTEQHQVLGSSVCELSARCRPPGPQMLHGDLRSRDCCRLSRQASDAPSSCPPSTSGSPPSSCPLHRRMSVAGRNV